MTDKPTLLLEHHLKEVRLPSFLREYGKLAAQCAAENVDHPQYLLRLAELELIDRHQRMVERRIRAARFPAVKSLDTFDFLAIPSVNKALVMELARCEYTLRRENVIAVGNSGTGKTHIALGLGLAACQRGMSVGFTTAAGLVNELMEARDERRLLNLQRQLSRLNLLIIDELGFVPLSRTGAELLFEVFSQRYERGSTMVTTNLPFDEWTEVFGSERLTGALLDRLTHHVHILEMNGESYRLKRSRESAASQAPDDPVTPNPFNTPVGSHPLILSPTLPDQPTATLLVVHHFVAPVAHFAAAIDRTRWGNLFSLFNLYMVDLLRPVSLQTSGSRINLASNFSKFSCIFPRPPIITTTHCQIWCLILRIRPRARNRGKFMAVGSGQNRSRKSPGQINRRCNTMLPYEKLMCLDNSIIAITKSLLIQYGFWRMDARIQQQNRCVCIWGSPKGDMKKIRLLFHTPTTA